MKYIVFILCSLVSFSLMAEESEILVQVSEPSSEDEIDKNLPQCDDALLVENAAEEIKKYLAAQTNGSIIEKRNRNLVLNYISSYKEKGIDDFDPKENYLVADTKMRLKINKHIRSENMRLCVSEGKKPVYLLIYPEDFRYNVEIINISPSPEGISFLYTPQIKKYEKFED